MSNKEKCTKQEMKDFKGIYMCADCDHWPCICCEINEPCNYCKDKDDE